MGKNISYNARTFEDYKEQLKLFTQKYYPTTINNFNDASVGQWFIDLNSAVADDLGYYMDRMFQETQLDQAQDRKSILNIARTNGLRVDGRKPSIVEVEWSCFVPINSSEGKNGPDYNYAPIIHKGTQASGGGQKFETIEDINFAQQFNSNGVSDRTFIPIRNTNGKIEGYNVTKTCIMSSGESRLYKQPISASDIMPFMEIILPENNVISIQSVIIKDGYNKPTPTPIEFMADSDNRWYEVSNLADDRQFKKNTTLSLDFATKLVNDLTENNTNITSVDNYGNTYVAYMEDDSKVYGFIPNVGKWENVNRKFITEYTDNGYCKIIFGGGTNNSNISDSLYSASDFARYQINKIVNNNYLGELPKPDSTIYVYYTVGGGAQSNVAAGAITSIPYLNLSMNGVDTAKINKVKTSIKVRNTTPSVSGRDELSTEEIRFLIKYNNAAQDRCVTIKDYYNKIMTMPSQFGSPFKVGVCEKNNKILITLLGLSHDGALSKNISQIMIDNMVEYLSEYKMINDYVQIQAGKVINIRFEVDVTIDSNQEAPEVAKNIALYIGDYMDINKHKLGDEVYVSKIKSTIGGMNGVKNLIDLRVYNVYGSGYSNNHTRQAVVGLTKTNNSAQIDLVASDGILFSDEDTMFEIKNPKVDIIINTKYK